MTLANYPVPKPSFVGGSKIRPRLYTEAHTNMKSKYDSFGASTEQPNCPFSVDDVGYIIEEVFRGRSILEPFHTTRLAIVKWRPEGNVDWGNVVCLTKAEGKIHEKRVLKGNESLEGVYGKEVVGRVDEIWKEERELRAARWGNMYST
jgi:tRNA threonylcarbamoyladenosine dehydratase